MKKYVVVLAVIELIVNYSRANSEDIQCEKDKLLDDVITYPFHKSSPIDVIKYYNYTGEEHKVKNSDGFTLTMHRITNSSFRTVQKKNSAVLLQHGLFSSSMDWIITGRCRSLAFMLADLGFDVWLGNFRSNTFSQKHESLTANDSEYWNFSWHELGISDLPAMIDYILDVTELESLTYIGHSQGNTASYVLLSEHPEYNQKISELYSFAPVTFFTHGNFGLKLASFIFNKFNQLAVIKVEGVVFDEEQKKTMREICDSNMLTRYFCQNLKIAIYSSGEQHYNEKMMDVVWEYHPSGSSLKQIIHFTQIILSGRFAKFDYGNETNWIKYNRSDPPEYNLKNVKVDAHLIYSPNDIFTVKEDAIKLYKHITNPMGLYKIPNEHFNHFDFLWAKNVNRILYDNVIKLILEHEEKIQNEITDDVISPESGLTKEKRSAPKQKIK